MRLNVTSVKEVYGLESENKDRNKPKDKDKDEDEDENKGCVFDLSPNGTEIDVHYSDTGKIQDRQFFVLSIGTTIEGKCRIKTIKAGDGHLEVRGGASCNLDREVTSTRSWEQNTWKSNWKADEEWFKAMNQEATRR
ncbi:hypothetical protein QFC19_004769 [Naganishia cerealis]|uniref:Uncharacterized protein n=1 Tax=Naganishia cerealis TaxID=610337 RepID=A0ACC2VUZ6_9TREE|nr:hypothetical protein QFC19_004769 [Naganishia cerealis]